MALFGTKKPRLQAKVLPRFPVRVEGENGISAAIANGIATIGPDFEQLPVLGWAETGYLIHWDADTDVYSRIAVSNVAGPQSWVDIQYYEPEFVSYIYMEPVVGGVQGIVGTSLKYTDWWITETKIYRVSKPSSAWFTSAIVDVVAGGGGGGSSGPAGSTPSTGAGGAGGAQAQKTISAADFPDEVVIVVGKGGVAGGWDKTVHFPEDGDFPGTPSNFVPGQGVIFEVGNGTDGDFSAFFDAADWDALGADDDARLTAFRGLTYDQQKAVTIMLCTEGKGGLNPDDTESVEADGGQASGGDHNRNGSDSSGGGYYTNHTAWRTWFEAITADLATTESTPAGGIGAGGAAGGRALNDGLWENHAKPHAGFLGQMAGAGGSPKTSNGNHDGSHGGIFGGGGGGGQAGSPQDDRVIPGGMGGWGGVRIIVRYEVPL